MKWLKSKFKKELHFCPGVDFERIREAHTITMNQRSYIQKFLKRFNMIFHLQWVRWANSFQRLVYQNGWPRNASWGIWKASWTSNYVLEGRTLYWEFFCIQSGREMQTTNNPPWGTCYLLALDSFRENAKNDQPLHYLQWRQNIWVQNLST